MHYDKPSFLEQCKSLCSGFGLASNKSSTALSLIKYGLIALLCLSACLFVGVLSFKISSNLKPEAKSLEQKASLERLGLHENAAEDKKTAEASVSEKVDKSQDQLSPPEEIYVHVDGQVASPGLYKLPQNSRVDAAIKAAGGLLEQAQTKDLNLAQSLSDGAKLYIPALGEQYSQDGNSSSLINIQGDKAAQEIQDTSSSGLININTADVAGLQKISGVGKKTAEAIIADRKKQGPFKKIKDICRVSGIGAKKFEQMKHEICV